MFEHQWDQPAKLHSLLDPAPRKTLSFLHRQGLTRGNPYSLSAAPDGRGLRITVKELGDGSAGVRALRPGTPVLFEGPSGG